MMIGRQETDLLVLVADLDMELTVKNLLGRPASLRIQDIRFRVHRHQNHDPGCRAQAAEFLRRFAPRYRYTMVMFDKEGCGREKQSREDIQYDVERDLARNGWRDRSKAIVIDPELEAWIWNGSDEVAHALGWNSNYASLRTWLGETGIFPENDSKPRDPKRAMKSVLNKTRARRQPSAALFGSLAASVSLNRCQCPAFNEFKGTLQHWFPKVI